MLFTSDSRCRHGCYKVEPLHMLHALASSKPFERLHRRTNPLAAVTLPVLELEGKEITLSYRSTAGAGHRRAAAPAQPTDVPCGFGALWLRGDSIRVRNAGHLGDEPAHYVEVADELCRFLSLAPECYREFRLYVGSRLSMYVDWVPLPNGVAQSSNGCFFRQQSVVGSIQQFAGMHGLAASMAEDQTHVRVVRVEAPPSSESGYGPTWAWSAAGSSIYSGC